MNSLPPPSVGQPHADDQGMDLAQLLRILFPYKWRVLFFAIVISVFVTFLAFSMEPFYRATTTVLVESEKAKVVSIEDAYSVNTSQREYFKTQVEILKSRDLAARTVKRLKLESHPLFAPKEKEKLFDIRKWIEPYMVIEEVVYDPAVSEGLAFDAIVDSFMVGLDVAAVPDTRLLKIHYVSSDAVLAAKITNTLAELYIESHLEAKLGATRKAADWLSERIGDLKQTLKLSEDKLQEYRDQEQLVDVDGVRTVDASELRELTQKLAESRQTKVQLETIARQISSLGSRPGVDELLKLSDVLKHPLVQSLRRSQSQTELKVAELSKRYGPGHPKMISAKSEAESAMAELRLQVVGVAAGIESDYRNAINTERALQGQVDRLKSRLQSVNRKEFQYKALEREVETNRHLYDLFLTRSKEVDESSGLESSHARVVDPAVVPRTPFKPNKKMMIAAAFIVSIFAGVALVLLKEMMNNTIRGAEDVEVKLQSSVLGFLPLVKSNKSEAAYEGFLSSTSENFAESIRTIRTALMLSALGQEHRVTLVTSSVPNEGKSTVALNLAEAIGQMGKVLLIDADMRRPTLAKTLNLPRATVGLSDFLLGSAALKECIRPMGEGVSVDVMTSGVVSGNPLELISSDRFRSMLQKLSAHYDRVIIDSAPTHAVSDSLLLSTYADDVVYIVKADDTPAPIVAKSVQRLKDVGGQISGVVLNKVDMDKAGRYGAYYKEYYQYGYSAT